MTLDVNCQSMVPVWLMLPSFFLRGERLIEKRTVEQALLLLFLKKQLLYSDFNNVFGCWHIAVFNKLFYHTNVWMIT